MDHGGPLQLTVVLCVAISYVESQMTNMNAMYSGFNNLGSGWGNNLGTSWGVNLAKASGNYGGITHIPNMFHGNGPHLHQRQQMERFFGNHGTAAGQEFIVYVDDQGRG